MKVIGAGFVMAVVLAGAAMADPVTAKQAKKALFAPVKAEVVIMPEANLPEDQAKTLEMAGATQAYYGAIAMSPEDGLLTEATVLAANYHNTEAASVAALADCNAKKKGKSDCVVVAIIRPKGWKDRDFQLSSDATAAVKTELKKSMVMAISQSTGAWAIGADDAAAVEACAAKNEKASDCAVVIAN